MADDAPQKGVLERAVYEKAGPAFLAQQPNSAPVKKVPEPAKLDWVSLRSHLEQRMNSLRTWRSSWWTQNWAQIAEFIDPRRSIWLTQSSGGWPTPNNMTRGKNINTSIVDPTGTFALRVCAGGLMSGLASPSRPWFKLVPSIKGVVLDQEGQKWVDEVEDRVYTVLASCNFYNSFAQECEDVVCYGTAPVIIYEDETDVIRLYNPVCGEYFLGASATLRVNVLNRAFVMTISQIVEFFGLDACPAEVKKLWQEKGGGLDKEMIVAHSIEPNFEVGDNKVGKIPGKFTWREVYWLFGQPAEKPLSVHGFMEQPFTASRWSTQGNDAYGRSAGMDVLPDIIQLQVMTIRHAEAIEKHVRPPLQAPMQLKNQPSSILPGHVTYVPDPKNGMTPIFSVMPDITGMVQNLEKIQQRIRTGFFNDLFLMLEQSAKNRMTAYEVAQKMQEKLQVLGPVIEGLMGESLKPKLKRIFEIMKRRGMIPPMPASMKGVAIDIEFVSMLALAQKAAATGGLERIADFVMRLSQSFPHVVDNMNPDELVREMNRLLGNAQKIMTPEEAMAHIRAQAAQAAQKQEAAQGAQQAAGLAEQASGVAKNLGSVEVGGGANAFSELMGQGGGVGRSAGT